MPDQGLFAKPDTPMLSLNVDGKTLSAVRSEERSTLVFRAQQVNIASVGQDCFRDIEYGTYTHDPTTGEPLFMLIVSKPREAAAK